MAIETLSAKIDADVKGYVTGLQQATIQASILDKATLDMAANTRRMADAIDALGKKLEGGGDKATKMLSAFKLAKMAVRDMEELGKAAIDAANAMDPSGAEQWKQSVDALRNAALTFAGGVGKELRPALEWVMQNGVKAFHWLERIDFKRWASDTMGTFRILGDAILRGFSAVGEGVATIAETLVKLIAAPFQGLQVIITTAFSSALDFAGTTIGKIVSLLGPMNTAKLSAGLGVDIEGAEQRLSGAAATMREEAAKLNIGDQFVGMVKGGIEKLTGLAGEAGAALGKAMGDKLTDSLGRYIKQGPIPEDHQFGDANSARAQKAENMLDAMRLKNQAQLEGLQRQNEMAEEAAAKHVIALRMVGLQAQVKAQDAAFQRDLAHLGEVGNTDQARAAVMQTVGTINALYAKEEALHQEGVKDAYVRAAIISSASDDELAAAKEAVSLADQNMVKTTEALKTAQGVAKTGAIAAEAAAKQQYADALAAQKEAIKNAAEASKLQAAADQGSITAAIEVARLHEEAAKRLQAVWTAISKTDVNFTNTARQATGSVLGSAGLGGAMSGAEQGFQAGGPMGAAAGAIASFVASSKPVQEQMKRASEFFQGAADALGGMIAPLMEIRGWGVYVGRLAQSFREAVPGLTSIQDALGRMNSTITTKLMASFSAVGTAMGRLLSVTVNLDGMAKAIDDFTNGLVMVIQTLDYFVANAADMMGGVLKSIHMDDQAQAAFDFANGMRQAAVASGEAAAAQSQVPGAANSAAMALTHVASAAQQAANALVGSIQNLYKDLADQQEKGGAATSALSYAMLHPLADDAQQKALIDALRKQAEAAGHQAALDQDLIRIENLRLALASGSGEVTQADLDTALQQYAYDQAAFTAENTAATSANTKATQAVGASLSNLPIGFKIAYDRYLADSGVGASPISALGASSSGGQLGAHAGGASAAEPLSVTIILQGDVSDAQIARLNRLMELHNWRAGNSRRLAPGPAMPGGRSF